MAFDSAVCEFVDLALEKLATITCMCLIKKYYDIEIAVESPVRNRSMEHLEIGSAVIFPMQECWVEGTIIDYYQEDDIYIVEDSDRIQYKARRKQIIVKPKVRKQQPVQTFVLAHFPDTTAFYEGTIVTASMVYFYFHFYLNREMKWIVIVNLFSSKMILMNMEILLIIVLLIC